MGRLAQTRAAHAQLYHAIVAALRDSSAIPSAVAALNAANLSSSERAAWAKVLGAHEIAFATLAEAVRVRDDVSIPFLLLHPLLAPLRDDPRFPRIH
jgi:hypothetical protein